MRSMNDPRERYSAVHEIRRLDAEIERLEQLVATDQNPIHRMMLDATRATRASAERALMRAGWHPGPD